MNPQLRSKKSIIALAVAGAAFLSVVVWFLLVSPERSKVGKLDRDIAAAQQKITERKAALAFPKAELHVRASDTFRLSKAMPSETDMSGIILSLNRLARARGLNLSAITPSTQVLQTGFTVQPLSITVEGAFPAVSGFLADTRRLVRVHKHALAASGRLLSVDEIDLTQDTASSGDSKTKAGAVKAALTIDAFLFAGGALGVPTTPSTPSASSGTVAAGATP